MANIRIFDKSFKPYLSEKEIGEAIDGVAAKMNADFKDSGDIPVLLCVMNGAIMYTSELMKRLDFPCELAGIKVSSYVGTKSTGSVHQVTGISGNIVGKTVIICEDIVDTGNTIVALKGMLLEKGAKRVLVNTMLLKPEVYDKDVQLEYVAKEIPNDFIVGFGLDYNELGRNYKDIYILDK